LRHLNSNIVTILILIFINMVE